MNAADSFVRIAAPKQSPTRTALVRERPWAATRSQKPASTKVIAGVSSRTMLAIRTENGSSANASAATSPATRPASERAIANTSTHDTAEKATTR